MPFEFSLPALPATLKKGEEKRELHASPSPLPASIDITAWSFAAFTQRLMDLAPSQTVKNCIQDILRIENDFTEQAIIYSKYKTFFEKEENIKALLETLIAARLHILEAAHKNQPQTPVDQIAYLTETHKRMVFMTSMVVIFQESLLKARCETEWCAFFNGFFEDACFNLQNASEGVRSDFAAYYSQLQSYVAMGFSMAESVFPVVVRRMEQSSPSERNPLFSMMESTQTLAQYKIAFKYGLGKDKEAEKCLEQAAFNSRSVTMAIALNKMESNGWKDIRKRYDRFCKHLTESATKLKSTHTTANPKRVAYASILETTEILSRPMDAASVQLPDVNEKLEQCLAFVSGLKPATKIGEAHEEIKKTLKTLCVIHARHYDNALDLLELSKNTTKKLLDFFGKDQNNVIAIQITARLKEHIEQIYKCEETIKFSQKERSKPKQPEISEVAIGPTVTELQEANATLREKLRLAAEQNAAQALEIKQQTERFEQERAALQQELLAAKAKESALANREQALKEQKTATLAQKNKLLAKKAAFKQTAVEFDQNKQAFERIEKERDTSRKKALKLRNQRKLLKEALTKSEAEKAQASQMQAEAFQRERLALEEQLETLNALQATNLELKRAATEERAEKQTLQQQLNALKAENAAKAAARPVVPQSSVTLEQYRQENAGLRARAEETQAVNENLRAELYAAQFAIQEENQEAIRNADCLKQLLALCNHQAALLQAVSATLCEPTPHFAPVMPLPPQAMQAPQSPQSPQSLLQVSQQRQSASTAKIDTMLANMDACLGQSSTHIFKYLEAFIENPRMFSKTHRQLLRSKMAYCLAGGLAEYAKLLSVLVNKPHCSALAFDELYQASLLQGFVPIIWPDRIQETRFINKWSTFVKAELQSNPRIDIYTVLNLLLLAPHEALRKTSPQTTNVQRAEALAEDLSSRITLFKSETDELTLRAEIKQGLPELVERFEAWSVQAAPAPIIHSGPRHHVISGHKVTRAPYYPSFK